MVIRKQYQTGLNPQFRPIALATAFPLREKKDKVFLPLCPKMLRFLSEIKCSSPQLLDEIEDSALFDTVKFLKNMADILGH